MLKKLLKYDLQKIYKFLIVFYTLAIFFAILTRIFLNIDDSLIMYIIGQICMGACISMMFSILINNLMRLWVSFKSNFYGDEAYLTHTLPVEKSTLYLSKVITSVITLFTSILIIGISLFIMYYSKENIIVIKNILLPVADAYNSTIIRIVLSILFVFFLEFANILQSGYTGILLGYKMNNNKIGFSILFGFIVYIVTQLFALLIIFIGAIFNQDIMNLFYTTEVVNIDAIKIIIYMAIFIYTMALIIGYFINLKLFNKGVNVD